MNPVYQATPADLAFFDDYLRDFLPDEIIDLHSHMAPPGTMQVPSAERVKRNWALALPMVQTVEEYLAAYEALLPGKRVSSAVFGMPVQESDVVAQNEYILEASRRYSKIRPFFVTRPEDDEACLEAAVERGFVGFKPYPDFVRSDHPGEERIEEFLTPAMCNVASRHGVPVMLHISRSRRFADPANIRELVELADRWPHLRVIIAHLGRSYTRLYLEEGLKLLGGRCDWWYDFSAVANPEVHRLALEAVPHERLCFGLDNPLMLARGYYDFPAPDRYSVHFRDSTPDGASQPPLAYQILLGFRQAAQELGLSRESIQKIFYQNAVNLLSRGGGA